MSIFLDTYYYYSWVRLSQPELRQKLDKVKKRFKVRSVLLFEDLQLRSITLGLFVKYVEKVIRLLDQVYRDIVVNRRSTLDLLKLMNMGFGDEHIPALEYLLIADEEGKVPEDVLSAKTLIKLDSAVWSRINALIRSSAPPFKLDATYYREYLARKVGKILGLQIEKVTAGTMLREENLSNVIEDIKRAVCFQEPALKQCPIVKEGKNIENHSNDVKLALALTHCAKNRTIIVVTVPEKWECFRCSINYLKKVRNLQNRIHMLEEIITR